MQRLEVLEKLNQGALDIAAVTSALVCVQPNIRAVVHVCVPETILRFYQWKLGAADAMVILCIATIWTEEDRKQAKGMSTKRDLSGLIKLGSAERYAGQKVTSTEGYEISSSTAYESSTQDNQQHRI